MLIPVPADVWVQSYYVDLEKPIPVRCPRCWEEIHLTKRLAVALFLHRSLPCQACDIPLEKSEFWPYPLSKREADKQYERMG